MNKKAAVIIAVSLLLALLGVVLSVSVGASGMPLDRALNGVLGRGSAADNAIIQGLRLPRALLAYLVGACLAVAGALLQGVFINPMADPQILGVSAGAGLGAAVVIAYGAFLGQIGVGVGAFIGGIVAVLTILFVTRGGRSAMSLILSGLALTSFLSAISFFIMVLNRNKMDQIMLWTMGGFTAVSWEKVLFLAPVAILGFFIALAFARNLNLISSGEEDAWHLGVDVERVRRSLLLLVAAMTAAAVSVSGMIGFVGLMVPHMVRILAGPDHRGLIPCSFCVGGVFLMLTDTLARVLAAPLEIPVGVITALLGTPFFIYLIKRRSL
ncbi:iron ABC transporter permease [Christensenella sp. MSJ-20]|uniref:FecCD family ABC transporter permease n=1 Tax=Christensenella sp. MSJ-20 TaxID=2841518 RepID=UPI000D78CE77|nr:MAG: iron ABC transporter [Bacillota bacterium]QWT55447.1 iron ABC transporter permease [Christensenella sp. MSJ-20]